MTGGSVGSHTPPSPGDEARTGAFKPSSVIMERASSVRSSFEQRQPHGTTNETVSNNNNNINRQQGSPAQSGGTASGNSSGPHTPYRLQPHSPATSGTTGAAVVNSQMPQKSPFDMTTMGMSRDKSGGEYSHSPVASQSPNTSRSPFTGSS